MVTSDFLMAIVSEPNQQSFGIRTLYCHRWGRNRISIECGNRKWRQRQSVERISDILLGVAAAWEKTGDKTKSGRSEGYLRDSRETGATVRGRGVVRPAKSLTSKLSRHHRPLRTHSLPCAQTALVTIYFSRRHNRTIQYIMIKPRSYTLRHLLRRSRTVLFHLRDNITLPLRCNCWRINHKSSLLDKRVKYIFA